mgnify:CR=1 FL=1
MPRWKARRGCEGSTSRGSPMVVTSAGGSRCSLAITRRGCVRMLACVFVCMYARWIEMLSGDHETLVGMGMGVVVGMGVGVVVVVGVGVGVGVGMCASVCTQVGGSHMVRTICMCMCVCKGVVMRSNTRAHADMSTRSRI